MKPAQQLEAQRNLGPVSARRLRAVGIADRADLAEIGPVQAYVRVEARFESTSLTLLWALFGALVDLDWRDLPAAERSRLRDEVERVRQDTALQPSPIGPQHGSSGASPLVYPSRGLHDRRVTRSLQERHVTYAAV